MINKELKLKYIKSLKDGGRIPKYLTAWGKLDKQNELDNWVNNWLFRTTPLSNSKIIGGWKPGSRNGHVESDEEYTVRRIKEEQDSAKKRTRHIKKAADTAHMIGTLALPAGIVASAAVSLPTTLGGIAGGIVGEKAVDYGLGKLADATGSNVRSWKDLTNEYLGWSPTLLMLSNPGTLLGGGIGAKGALLVNKAANYTVRMDMPRFGYIPTTLSYFKPGYVGMNGGSPIARQTGRMRTINSILLELRLRFGREATPQEIELFINNNPGLQLGIFEHPIRGRQTVITGSLDAFNNAETNLTRILQEDKLSNILSGVNDDMYEIQLFLGRPTTGLPIRTRNAKEVKLLGRYTEGDLKFPNGSPNPNLRPSWLVTGAHGKFISSTSSPNMVASNLLLLVNNPSLGTKELFKVLRDNPRGRSGVLIHTHTGDLSVDSHPLSHSVLEMQGFERIIPTRGYNFDGRVVANSHGYKNLFVDPKEWELEPSLLRYINADSLNIKLGANSPYYTTRETDGSLIIHETSSDRAVGRIPAKEAEDVLENAFNAPIRETNKHFRINLPKAIIGKSGGENALWTFRREIEYPSFGGPWGSLGLKKGGKLIK